MTLTNDPVFAEIAKADEALDRMRAPKVLSFQTVKLFAEKREERDRLTNTARRVGMHS